MSKKINSIENLKKILFKLKTKRKKIVLCHGVFDLLHIGHINHFYEARNYGDILIVTVTSDQYVNKGPNRPAFNEENRLKALAALNVVDYVALNNSPTAISAIKELKPNVYCKGQDYKFHKNDVSGEIKNEINALKKNRGRIIFTKGATFSSSNLINKFSENYSPEQKTEINKIKKKFTFLKIRKSIESFKKLKVLIIGETIIDQYIFCEALGKSGKEPVLVLRDIKMEEYLGGAGAICRHLSTFCKKITLLSMVGEKREFLSEIKKKLPKNIDFKYVKKTNSPTIVKKRYLDNLNRNKIFGIDTINDDFLNEKNEKYFSSLLRKNLSKHDLVIVSDYGHGLISNKNANLICRLSKYLALNAQVNAANIGYHSMRKYRNIDCLIINEKEIRHEMRDKKNKIGPLMKKLSSDQNIKNIIVTMGIMGSKLYEKKNNRFYHCEAFTQTVVDKVGAGDSMLSVVALGLKSNFDKNVVLLTGSLAAAKSVETIGNKEAINKIQLLKSFNHILK
jgi:rfaE bifunctional protein kinase chain/domain/rfaE bifunctional protein nucleotidyltransferase chain/domain